jgi:hypothetical protein
MVTIWDVVQREMHLRDATSVLQACKRLIERHGRLVFEDSATGDKLTLGALNPLNPFLIGAYQ